MSNKEIKFSARLDDTQLNQDIANFQKKLKELQDSSNRMAQGTRLNQTMVNNGLPAMSQYGQQAYQNAYNNNNNSARQAFAAEVEQLKKLEQVRESLTKKLDRQTQIQETMKAQGKDLLEIEQRRADTAERLSKAQNAVNDKLTVLNSGASQLRPDMKPGEQFGPPAPPAAPPSPGMFSNIISSLGGAAAIVAGIAKAVQVGNAVYRGMAEAPISATASWGSAMAGTGGREIAAIYSGRSAVENAYLPEKAQSAAMAGELLRRREKTGVSDILAKIVGSTALGAGAGAIGGSVVPVLGTGAGAVVGGLGGFLGSVGSAAMDKNSLYTVLEAMGSKSAGQARQGYLAEQYAGDYNRSLTGMKEMNPLKKEAIEQYTANSGKYLQFQRQMGLNYNSFHGEGGFRGYATANGFGDEQAMSMAGQIMSAGGSTGGGPNAASRNAILGLQSERNFNLTNAGSILGKLSGVNSNSTENKEALVRILAEGTRLGFDGSHYVEESRKFTETVSEIVSRGGSGSAEDAARAARSFSGFVTNPGTTAGMEGAKSAYERYQDISSSTSGAKGVMRASFLLSNPKMNKMSQESMINLEGLSEEQLTENNPIVTRAAREAGYKDVGKFIEDFSEGNRKAITRRPLEGIRARLNEYQKKNNITLSPQNYQSQPEEIQKLYEQAYGGVAIDQQGKMDLNTGGSLTSKFLGPSGARAPTTMTPEETRAKLESQAKTGKVEDETIRAAAESSDFILKNFRSMKDEIVPSAEAIHKFNQGLSEFVAIVSKMPKDMQSQVYAKMNAGTVNGGTAPQGGTPTPGK